MDIENYTPANAITWHPYTQMQTAGPPVNIVKGKGAYLFDEKGSRYIDAISSWWTNLHGHAHPYIAQKIGEQAQQLEQVIFAGFTHPTATQLAEQLLKRIPYHHKVFYSDNGSTAVEVAIKMALQYWANKGEERIRLIAFRDAYHGDTFGSMSISARGVFTQAFQKLLFDVYLIDTPTPGNEEKALLQLENMLQQAPAAFIFEPLVLGSAGMLMYSAATLDKMIGLCRQYGVLSISDEVMTGFGRTGKFMAVDHCQNKPDIICMSKGITGGFMPFAATTCRGFIYDAFLSADKMKMFFHGHSYTGNALGCAAALASLQLFETENTIDKIADIAQQHGLFAESIQAYSRIKNVRQQGTILAIELAADDAGYLSAGRDNAYRYFMERRIILRPLGNVLYILPPYCISRADLQEVYGAICEFLTAG